MNRETLEWLLFAGGAVLFFVTLVWSIRRKPVKHIQAVVSHAEAHLPVNPPSQFPLPVYQVTFLSAGEKYHFTVSQKQFSSLPKGTKGKLTYRGCEFISFQQDES